MEKKILWLIGNFILGLLIICALGLVQPDEIITQDLQRSQDLGNQKTKLYGVAEWSLQNSSISGNPFDLIADVTFKHSSGETRKTQMFYTGNNTYSFRFNGSRSGKWTFTTKSSDKDLNGRKGTVTVSDTAEGKGFVVPKNGYWARSNGEVFIPQLAMFRPVNKLTKSNMDGYLKNLMDDHGFNGVHLNYIAAGWFDKDSIRLSDNHVLQSKGLSLDLNSFDVLETLIRKVYAKGGMVHIWQWGDNSFKREATLECCNLSWGGNRGNVAKRLERYIAARLSALPGWTIGFGFDLFEWTNGAEVEDWSKYLKQHMGWEHLHTARGGPYHENNGLKELTTKLPIASFEAHRPTFTKKGTRIGVPSSCKVPDLAIKKRGDRPIFMEDRFRVRQGSRYDEKDYSPEMTRRGLYLSAVCGGFANTWGHLINSPDGKNGGTGDDLNGGSGTYPNKTDIKRYFTFMKGKMQSDMVRDDSLINAKYGYCMRSGDRKAICYAEGVIPNSSLLELSTMQDGLSVKYLNTTGGSNSKKGDYAIAIGY